jgi:hypothetical protein
VPAQRLKTLTDDVATPEWAVGLEFIKLLATGADADPD